MDELRDLYQQVIIDHNKNPRNFGKLDDANYVVEGFNPLCGDHLNIYLDIKDDMVSDVMFDGSGCAISKASASIMTTLIKGKSKEDSFKLFDQFHELVTGNMEAAQDLDALGKMAVFAGVREFPARVKCASLCWHTMKSALSGNNDAVTTE